MYLDGGGWDDSDQIDLVIGDDPVDRATPYSGTESSIDGLLLRPALNLLLMTFLRRMRMSNSF